MSAVRASVAIPRPVRRLFTYAVPDELQGLCRPGVRVVVPFGNRRLTGYLLAVLPESSAPEKGRALRRVEEVLDPEPVLDSGLLELTRWASEYYLVSWGEMIRAALPGLRGAVRRDLALTAAGQAALEAARQALTPHGAAVIPGRRAGRELLHEIGHLTGPGGGAARLADVKRRLGARFTAPALAALVRAGLVETIDAAAGAGRRPRTEAHALLAPRPAGAPSPRGARQRALLETLEEAAGEMRVKDLLERSDASRASLAPLVRQGLVRLESRESPRRPLALQIPAEPDVPLTPTPDQAAAIAAIGGLMRAGAFATCLLHGVTGSGKTEVYLRSIEAALAAGRGALYLVPEIALTPLLARRLRRRFGEVLALLHSGLSEGERHDEWRRIRNGAVKVVLGARSAVFAPLHDPGLIVIDEEHDASYKQDEYPRYNGRDLAIVRGRMSRAVVVLGSATPSMESYQRALEGRHRLLRLPERIGTAGMPIVERVDMRREFREAGGPSVLSRRLVAAIDERLRRGEQSLVLLNRRGFSTFVLCRACGAQENCRRCSIAMTLHLRQRELRCHYCDDRRAPPATCAACGSDQLHFGGTGTERLEDRLRERFPAARIARMDRDTVSTRGAAESLLTRVERGEIDILLGTQMIAKGHDFPHVTLVGVLAADALLSLPDFRAGERTFQLLLQVAGRSGRRERGGEVIVQAYYADHHAIRTACEHDFEAFARDELTYRRVMGYPPYSALARLLVRDRSFERAMSGGAAIAGIVRALRRPAIRVLGPAPAPLERLRSRYRVQVILKGESRREIQETLATTLQEAERRRLRLADLVVDVDPISTM